MKSPYLLLLFVQIAHYVLGIRFWVEFYVVVHMLNLGVDVRLFIIFFHSLFRNFGIWAVEKLVPCILYWDFVFFCTFFASLSKIWVCWVEWVHFLNWSFWLIGHELDLWSVSRFLSQIIKLRVDGLSTKDSISKVMAKTDATKLGWLTSPQFFTTPDSLIFKNRLSRFNFCDR